MKAITRDPRTVPAYTLADVARFVRLPVPTLRSWVSGRGYDTQDGPRRFCPLIVPAGHEGLSFINLIEAQVLAAIRKTHAIKIPKIRSALSYMRRGMGVEHPLAIERFETDGVDLFVRRGIILNASRQGQVAMDDVVKLYLRRIRYDEDGRAAVFFPFTRSMESGVDQPSEIVINPEVMFGRPVISGTRIDTATVLERFEAGESPEEIATDFSVSPEQVVEAVRCEVGWAKRAA